MNAGGWRDHEDRAVQRPDPPSGDAPAYWSAIGDFQGATYRRNAFAAGTRAEIDALWDRLELRAEVRILDVGCGNGRHLLAAAQRGATGVGVDVSEALVAAARDSAEEAGLADRVAVVRHDARRLGDVVQPGSFEVAWSLSQGAVGTDPAADLAIVTAMRRAVRPGGRVVVTFFHALFAARHLHPGDAFDPQRLVHHHVGDVRGPDDSRAPFDLWTTAYTAPSVRRLCTDAGLEVEQLVGARPGTYDADVLGLDDPELLVVCRRP